MRKALLSTVAGVAALLATGSMAQAADLYTPMAEPVPSVWTGFYVGAHAGYNKANYQGNWDPSEPPAMSGGDFDLNGFSGGIHAGYNWQMDSNFVFGIEGDVTGANMADFVHHRDPETDSNYTSSMAAQIDLLATVRGRLGLASGNSLFYITGGIAFADADFKACDPRDCGKWDAASDIGAVVGGGWEYKPASQVSLRLEGLYYMFDEKKKIDDNDFNVDTSTDDSMGLDDAFVVRVGVSYHPWN